MNQTDITVLLFSLTFLFGATVEDGCTNTTDYNLTECPSSDKFNLLECYDALAKEFRDDFQTEFFCWSRKDYDEKIIKNVTISTAHVKENDLSANINKPFSTQFTSNGTHLKCDTMEKWATDSINVTSTSFGYKNLPCVTSTISVAEIGYCNPLSNISFCRNQTEIGL